MTMPEALAAFTQEPLFTAANKFLKHLGVKCSTQTEEPIPFLDYYEEDAKGVGADVPKPLRKIFSRVEKTYFIGRVDADTLAGKTEAVNFRTIAAKPKYEEMFIFAVQMKDGEPLSRTEASHIVRGVNRLVKQSPATVLILEKGTRGVSEIQRHDEISRLRPSESSCEISLSIATCERTDYKQTWRPGEKLGRVSILKSINCAKPHHGHLDILASMDVKKAKTFDALYAQWQKVFSTSILTNKFYNELFDWYCWAIDKKTDVYFPNRPDDDTDDYEGIDTKIIRLITRIMFVWFIKQKNLVPASLFDVNVLKTILKNFDPLAGDSGCYYNAILQNLFFATLNRAIEDEDGRRRFAEAPNQVDAKNLYRYDELFTISRDEIVKLFSEVPFVNGSLFDCLDKTKGNDGVEKACYADGFSRNDKRVPATNHYKYRAFVPNNLFFDPKRGLFSIFERYNFTIEENTPMEQQVALDPELLGKVFENLLGVYNPETKETARKQSGSFYTPREIVNYMVDQSLISYLGDTPLVRKLFSDGFVYDEMDWSEYQSLAAKLKTVKILDPACGSGAFPVGMLNRIVEILQKLRSDNGNVFRLKRHIIENCIYGGDIQCIAAQITKLRFFISLIVNCEKDLSKPNFGIPELPNLETKFVAANSLIGVSKAAYELHDPKIDVIKEQLRKVRHEHFNARTAARKRKLVREDERLRKELSHCLCQSLTRPEDAEQLAEWNPYDQNTSAKFFDPEWMFGVKDGFDIVIGNPPYVQVPKGIYSKDSFPYSEGKDQGKQNLYKVFVELGYNLAKGGGGVTFIVQSSLMGDMSAKYTRELLLTQTQMGKLIEFPKNAPTPAGKVFKGVLQGTCIVDFIKATPSHEQEFAISILNDITTVGHFVFEKMKQSEVMGFYPDHYEFPLLKPGYAQIVAKVKSSGCRVGDYVCDTAQGNINTIHLRRIQSDNRTGAFIAKGIHIHRWRLDDTLFDCAITPETERIFNINLGKNMILSQNISGTTDKHRINATPFECRNTRIVFLHSANILYLRSPGDMKLVTAVLNSALTDWVFRITSTNNHLNMYELVALPMPNMDAESKEKIMSAVDKIMTTKKSTPNADISALETKIDETVFNLYGLTTEERALVMQGKNGIDEQRDIFENISDSHKGKAMEFLITFNALMERDGLTLCAAKDIASGIEFEVKFPTKLHSENVVNTLQPVFVRPQITSRTENGHVYITVQA